MERMGGWESGSFLFNFLTIFNWTVQDRIDETAVEEYSRMWKYHEYRKFNGARKSMDKINKKIEFVENMKSDRSAKNS
jgi:hypothetical protein